MAYVISSNSCLEAWRDACSFILQHGDGSNLIVEMRQPTAYTEPQLKEIIDSGITSKSALSDVINTIFPYKLHERKQGLRNEEFYDYHEKLYERGKRMHPKNKSRWGNYFLRFTRFGNNKKNQLQNIIDAINSSNVSRHACYLIHTSSIDIESNTRPIGAPCLQYVQFGQEDGNTINLTAVYRNHDFLGKALGNYVGLSRLLEFVCAQTHKQIGSLTCHSIHYFLEHKRAIRNCLDSLTW